MSTLVWKEEFALQQPRMDATHREFVAALAALEAAAPGTAALEALGALRAHTEAHFAQEEAWMARLGFAAENCHSMQHASVLEVVREVERRLGGAGGEPGLPAQLVKALAEWFPIHATMMDAALAMTMAERGFDPETGALAHPPAAEAAAITGCGGASCS